MHPPTTATEQLDADLICHSCGYLLRGLTAERSCPECGEPIAASVAWEHWRGKHGVRPLKNACPKLLRHAAIGSLLVVSSAIALAGATSVWTWGSRAAFNAIWVPVYAIWFVGLWMLLQPALVSERRWLVIVVWAARALSALWFICFAVGRFVELVVGEVPALVLPLGLTQLVTAAIATAFGGLYLDHLAIRAGRALGRLMGLFIAVSFGLLAVAVPFWDELHEALGLWRTPWPVHPFIGTPESSFYSAWWVLRTGNDPQFYVRQFLFPALFDRAGCLILVWFGVVLWRAARFRSGQTA